ncbi:MAG: UDP-N-acetylmuramoyl-L-alanyl-D-glutamate--2,6-diaminopimelate ligase [Longimicrobiales bacterium]
MTLPRPLAPDRVSVPLFEVAARLDQVGLLRSASSTEGTLSGVTDDSRAVEQGDLFCAWQGTSADSHDFVPAAARAGAAAAVVEHVLDDVELPQLVVSDGRRGAAAAASCVYGEPADQLVLCGVTGTNGKTTTAWLLRHLLAQHHRAALIGTLGLWFDAQHVVEGTEALTTPGPVDLAALLRTLVDRGVGSVAMEVSSHALDQGRVAGARFDVAIFTNLTRDHLDYHGTVDAYLAAKRSFVQLLRPTTGAAVVNADDPAWDGLLEQAPRGFTFSTNPERRADLSALNIALHEEGTDFDLATHDGSVAVRLPLLGDFNVQNALGAAAAALSLGFSLAEVAQALASAPQVPGRLERIATYPFPVLRDYAHTPDALERVLTTLRPLVGGRLIVVFGAGGDRDRGKRPLMGKVAQRRSDLAIVTSDNPRTEDPDLIIDEIAAGMNAGRYQRVTDRRHAIQRALDSAQSGDLILLAGKGHETYQMVGTTQHDFDERAVVRELLEQRQGRGA